MKNASIPNAGTDGMERKDTSSNLCAAPAALEYFSTLTQGFRA
ncbi:MAG: hypothetical protein ACXVJL_17105 [Candidatus Angelobacter sp.]